jgi:broad specificity phosphatase PhoE
VPITAAAERQAFEVGRALARRESGPILIMSGETRRATGTAAHLARGVTEGGGQVVGPQVAFALRNPDLYLAGVRVDMVSSLEAFADQVEGLKAGDVASMDFFPEFIESPDRIGWWLKHDAPPGEDARSLAARIRSFAASLVAAAPGRADVVVAVTNSPLVRAVGLDLLGRDIGEPPWVSGLLLEVGDDGPPSAEVFGLEAR